MDAVADGDDMAAPRHFLDIDRVDAAELRRMLDHGLAYKRGIDRSQPLQGKMLAMIFEKPSTRTRLSFEVAMKQLGGDCVVSRENRSCEASASAPRQSDCRINIAIRDDRANGSERFD